MIFIGSGLTNSWGLPYINPNFGTTGSSGSSGSSGTGGTGGTGGGSAVNFTQIRFEGGSSTSGTVGASNCIYEIYLFVNGQVELRLGNWANTGGISGHYSATGSGVSFSPTANTTYVWNAAITATTFYSSYQYINGALSASGSTTPSLGAASTGTWPPSGWTSLQNSSVDDNFVSVPITATTFFGISRTTAYVGSNAYITFGSGSSAYFSLGTTNPGLDKFMFNSGDRSYQRVAYRTGSK